jgi:hypothetical protein
VLIAAVGPEATFALNALPFLGVLLVLFVWRRPSDHRPLGTERVRGAIRAGARYVRSAPAFATVLGWSLMFMVFASGLWALLPAVARGPLSLGADGYGLLLAGVGLGAVCGAFVLPIVRGVTSSNALVTVSTLVYAAAVAVTGLIDSVPAVLIALVMAGFAWITVQSTLNASAQVLLPAWTRARALAYYQLVFMGGQALGAVVWGAVASTLGLRTAFAVPALGLLIGRWWAARRIPRTDLDFDVRQALHWPQPPDSPAPWHGPVLVTIEWRVAPANAAAFVAAMWPVGRARRRTGASLWGLFRDEEDPTLFLETFTVDTWHEHLRQHLERGTVMDREIEAKARRLTMEERPPITHHPGAAPAGPEATSSRPGTGA